MGGHLGAAFREREWARELEALASLACSWPRFEPRHRKFLQAALRMILEHRSRSSSLEGPGMTQIHQLFPALEEKRKKKDKEGKEKDSNSSYTSLLGQKVEAHWSLYGLS